MGKLWERSPKTSAGLTPSTAQILSLQVSRENYIFLVIVNTSCLEILAQDKSVRGTRHSSILWSSGSRGTAKELQSTSCDFGGRSRRIVKSSIEEAAMKVDRTPKAIHNMLRRNHTGLRDNRCDLFSVESLAAAFHVRKGDVISWIQQAWLQATLPKRGRRKFYTITP